MLMKINIKDPLPRAGEILIFYYVKDKYFSPASDSLPLPVFFCPGYGSDTATRSRAGVSKK